MTKRITIAGHDFNDSAPGDPVQWDADLTAGWHDGPELDVELLPTIGEGSALGRVMVRHRTIVVTGTADTEGEAAHDQAHALLENLVPIYEQAPLVVHEAGGPVHVMVSALSSPKVRCHGRAIEFQLTLVATNPHKQPHEETP